MNILTTSGLLNTVIPATYRTITSRFQINPADTSIGIGWFIRYIDAVLYGLVISAISNVATRSLFPRNTVINYPPLSVGIISAGITCDTNLSDSFSHRTNRFHSDVIGNTSDIRDFRQCFS